MLMDNSQKDFDKLNYVWAVPKDMQVDGVQKTLLRLVSDSSLALGEGFDTCKDLLEKKRIDSPRQVFLLRILLDSSHLTSESVLTLIGNCNIWNADILARSVVEGTVKFVYLSFGSREEVEQKVTEYDDILPEIARLKRHHRLKAFLDIVEDPNADEWRAFQEILLSETESEAIRARFPKRIRQAVEEKWSFHRLLKALSDSGIPELRNSLHLFYNYGMASHLLHQDADGVGMIWERNNRSDDRKDAVELAHASRIMSDLMMMNLMRHAMALRFAENQDGPPLSIYAKYRDLVAELHENAVRWGQIEYGTDAGTDVTGKEVKP